MRESSNRCISITRFPSGLENVEAEQLYVKVIYLDRMSNKMREPLKIQVTLHWWPIAEIDGERIVEMSSEKDDDCTITKLKNWRIVSGGKGSISVT